MLVVGGAGYIGSHAARLLRKQGFEAVIYDNLSTGYAALVRGFELVQGDLADVDKLARVMKRVTAVMHFAAHASVGESVANPRKYFRNNVEGGLALLNTAHGRGSQEFHILVHVCCLRHTDHRSNSRKHASSTCQSLWSVEVFFRAGDGSL